MEEEIDRQCAVCSHPDSYADRSSYLESGALELTLIDPEESHPDVESTRNVNPEESQPDVENQYSTETLSSFAVTYEIVAKEAGRS